jgi:large subunit ribosomal protein L23|tara:strand:- start:1144 stop:1437 length:294 start_codon:yes stop_codon:yes gene_type:complete
MSNIKNYQILLKPIVTEKSSLGSEYNQVTFQVRNIATKKEIKEAVENLFKVKVKKVNTLIVKGKRKTFRGTLGRRSDYKKAFVTLEDGQSIDINAGI